MVTIYIENRITVRASKYCFCLWMEVLLNSKRTGGERFVKYFSIYRTLILETGENVIFSSFTPSRRTVKLRAAAYTLWCDITRTKHAWTRMIHRLVSIRNTAEYRGAIFQYRPYLGIVSKICTVLNFGNIFFSWKERAKRKYLDVVLPIVGDYFVLN